MKSRNAELDPETGTRAVIQQEDLQASFSCLPFFIFLLDIVCNTIKLFAKQKGMAGQSAFATETSVFRRSNSSFSCASTGSRHCSSPASARPCRRSGRRRLGPGEKRRFRKSSDRRSFSFCNDVSTAGCQRTGTSCVQQQQSAPVGPFFLFLFRCVTHTLFQVRRRSRSLGGNICDGRSAVPLSSIDSPPPRVTRRKYLKFWLFPRLAFSSTRADRRLFRGTNKKKNCPRKTDRPVSIVTAGPVVCRVYYYYR